MSRAFHETAATGPCAARAAALQALVPALATPRLILRAPRIEDFDVFAAIVLGPQGAFYGAPADRDAAWGEFIQLTGTWYLRGHGVWTVTDRATGEVLGFVQIGAEPGDAEPELGFIVSAEAEGRGIAFEAASAVRDAATGPGFALETLVSYVDPGNRRSQKLATRLGGTRDRAAEAAMGADAPLIFRHDPTGPA